MGLLATILTQFINNGAVGVALMPVIYSYCSNMNVGRSFRSSWWSWVCIWPS